MIGVFLKGRGVVLFECAKETELRSQFNITRDERLLEYACIAWEKSLKEEVEKLTFTMNFQHNMEGETVSFFTIGQQLASCLGILGRSMLGLVNHAEDLFESS